MFIIFIIGCAAVYDKSEQVVDPLVLKRFNGINYADVAFTEFLPDADLGGLSRKLETGGGMYFSYKEPGKYLTVTTTYHAFRRLSDKQIAKLAGYTVSQWADGIGEGFETESVERFGYRVTCLLEGKVEQRPYPIIKVVEDE